MGIQRDSTTTRVFINGVEQRNAHVHSVTNYCGGRRANTAEFEIRTLGNDTTYQAQGGSIINRFAKPGFGDRLISRDVVDIATKERNGRIRFIHHGEIVGGSVQQTSRGEVVIYTSRFDDHLYGRPLYYTEFVRYIPRVRLPDGVTFNPVVDNRIFYNKSTSGSTLIYLPPSFATSEDLADITGSKRQLNSWTLIDAILYLQQYLLSGKHVRQMTTGYLKNNLPHVVLNNTSIRAGTYFPEALDILLEPYGFTWRLDYLTRTTRVFRVVEKAGFGSYGTVSVTPGYRGARGGTYFDDAKNLAPEFDLRIDTADECVDNVVVIGGEIHLQETLTLYPAWDKTLESASMADFIWDSPAMEANPALRDVYRRFTHGFNSKQWQQYGNTPIYGDKLSTKTENVPKIKFTRNGEVFDFWNEYGGGGVSTNMCRRPYLPMLTYAPLLGGSQPFGEIRGCHVEFRTKTDETSDWGPWKSILKSGADPGLGDAAHLEVDKDEGYVRFVGRVFPALFKQSGINVDGQTGLVELRLTTTRATGQHIFNSAAWLGNGATRILVVSIPDRIPVNQHSDNDQFPKRKKLDPATDGATAISLESSETFSTKQEMLDAIDNYLVRFWDSFKYPAINGTIRLHGCDYAPQVYLGQKLAKVGETELNRLPNQPSFPVITAIIHDFNAQTTQLAIGSAYHA